METTRLRRGPLEVGGRRLTLPLARETATGLLFLTPSLVLLAVFVFWPLLQTFSLSVHANDIVGRPTRFDGLQQYQLLFGEPALRQTLWNTGEFAALTVVPGIVLAVLLATALERRIRGIGVFRTLLATPFAFSVATASVVFAIFYNPGVGVFDGFLQVLHLQPVGWVTNPTWAMPSVALATVWLQLGYNVLVLSAGLQGIPPDVLEAADLDGAGPWGRFWQVTLPLVTPTLFFLLVVNTILALQSFGQIEILTRGGPAGATTTLVYGIYLNAFGFGSANFGLASAQAVVLLGIVAAITAGQFSLLERRVFYR